MGAEARKAHFARTDWYKPEVNDPYLRASRDAYTAHDKAGDANWAAYLAAKKLRQEKYDKAKREAEERYDRDKPLFSRRRDQSEEQAREATAEYRAEGNYVLIDRQTRNILAALLQEMGDPAADWDAVTEPEHIARRLLAKMETAASGPLARVVPSLRQAVAAGVPVIFVEAGPYQEEALREEQFHRAQILAGRGRLLKLNQPSTGALILSRGGLRIAQVLTAAGYTADELRYEIAAHAARGPAFWKEAGITPQEAREVLDLYFAAMAREHGKTTADRLRQAAPEEYDENGTRLQRPAGPVGKPAPERSGSPQAGQRSLRERPPAEQGTVETGDTLQLPEADERRGRSGGQMAAEGDLRGPGAEPGTEPEPGDDGPAYSRILSPRPVAGTKTQHAARPVTAGTPPEAT
jgi:hypothetical protein